MRRITPPGIEGSRRRKLCGGKDKRLGADSSGSMDVGVGGDEADIGTAAEEATYDGNASLIDYVWRCVICGCWNCDFDNCCPIDSSVDLNGPGTSSLIQIDVKCCVPNDVLPLIPNAKSTSGTMERGDESPGGGRPVERKQHPNVMGDPGELVLNVV